MKYLHFGFLVLFLFSLAGASAQQNHFIYIQTENKQPFYVKLDNKLYSSTTSGYVVIPKLKEGEYNLSVGFPKSEWIEQSMVCRVNKNDLGYILKNIASKGWALYDLQTSNLIMAGDNGRVKTPDVVNRTDAFSTILSSVVNDSTIRQTEILKEEEKKPSLALQTNESLAGQVTSESSKEVSSNVNDGKVNASIPKETEKTKEAELVIKSKPAIKRNLYYKSADGIEIVYTDAVNGEIDTIRVFIPAEKGSALTEENPQEVSKGKRKKNKDLNEIAQPSITIITGDAKPSEDKVIQDKEKAVVKVEAKLATDKPAEPTVQKTPMINSDCKSLASEEDFLKLRKKMAAEDNDDDMMMLAKKLFKAKCFNVEQVKNLSVLFLKDSGKYAFFDMAYPFVSDSHNFSTLQNQLTEAYYLNRFQVMIRH
ncbi:MAG: DUF4476 domain-containing protein [Ferruginibacter sp.]